MMISPQQFTENYRNAPYLKLIEERDRLIREIRRFEKNEIAGNRNGQEWKYCPSPDVRYQMHLEYLSGICCLMEKRYNEAYVWGGRTLKQDAETAGNAEGR